jgi:16S rRNA (guanine966-N2)-methyltransferase
LLRFPDAEGLRPTPDRVRQTLFNWLGQDLTGLRCLDLFAGTGVLGFESLSRGAREVVLVENKREVVAALKANQQALQADHAHIVQADALQFLASNRLPFDVIFCDPPYHQAWMEKCLPVLAAHLSPAGLVYAEAEVALQDTDEFELIKQGRAGHVFYHLLKPR